jgi:hypothetical protein
VSSVAVVNHLRHYACVTSRELADEWWYCMQHRRVERFDETDSANRIGPWPSADAAAHALQTIHEREKAYEAADAEWEGES